MLLFTFQDIVEVLASVLVPPEWENITAAKVQNGAWLFLWQHCDLRHFYVLTSLSKRVSYLIFSFFNDSRLLAPKYSEYFTGSAPPTLYSWSNSQIGCSAPLYSRSGSLIGSAYFSLYINFCFGFNKTLTNLTSLRQHHLQYKSVETYSKKFCRIIRLMW